MRSQIERLFPQLVNSRYEITSPRETAYNCVAWAAGDDSRWWWPAEPPFAYWPPGVAREESLASFIEALSTMGYEKCDAGDREADYEKLAIFTASDGVPTHMARQLADGSWTSKLGSLEDIRHEDIHALAGTEYGEVAIFLHRRTRS